MKNFIKKFDIILSFLSVTILTLIGLGKICLPESVVFYNDLNEFTIYKVYTVREVENTIVSVSATSVLNKTSAAVSLFGVIPVGNIEAEKCERKYVNVSGEIIGIRLYTDGLLVVETDEIITSEGSFNPATECGIKKGDIITEINDEKVLSIADFSAAVNMSDGNHISITAIRDNMTLYFSLAPVYCTSEQKYKCGLWLRDSTAGIGTMTFTDEQTGVFAALGHAICDSDTQSVLPLGSGDILSASVTGITKGQKGVTGQLMGTFTDNCLGTLILNNEFGIYGICDKTNILPGVNMPIASQTEIKAGDAQIMCNVDGNGVKIYDIEIEKIYYTAEKQSHSMVIEITDEELLTVTGGIVQGMSGSPIVQDGMLVGAVTHVFLNDPTKGYAIFAETMADSSQGVN